MSRAGRRVSVIPGKVIRNSNHDRSAHKFQFFGGDVTPEVEELRDRDSPCRRVGGGSRTYTGRHGGSIPPVTAEVISVGRLFPLNRERGIALSGKGGRPGVGSSDSQPAKFQMKGGENLVTAKFKVSRKSEMGWGTEVEFTPDYAQGRNAEWASATPAGMLRLTITNEAAANYFNEGDAVTLTLEKEEQ